MDIIGIAKSHQTNSTAAGKTLSEKEWKLSDSLWEKITEYAREDAAQNVYMGNKFLTLRKSEVAKVAPDRAALMVKLNQAMSSGNMADMKKIKEADERWFAFCLASRMRLSFSPKGQIPQSMCMMGMVMRY